MNAKIYLIIIISLIASICKSQPDCVIQFEYLGTIEYDSLVINKIGFPTTPFLFGYTSFDSKDSFLEVELSNTEIAQVMDSHLGQVFCDPLEKIIKRVFKGKREFFPIIIFMTKTETKLEYKVPMSQVLIEYNKEKERIIINLGRIRI